VLGLLGGFGLGYLAEFTDKRFRTPDEIRKALGLPVIGHMPPLAEAGEIPEAAEPGHPPLGASLIAYYRSRSPQAEAFRGVRTALYFGTAGQDHQVIQVTSPNQGDGKSTVAANLAVSVAQSGRRTLLVDADFRKPRVHKLFGLRAPTGFASVIVGEASLDEAVVQSGVENLWLCPCGPKPKNPAELLTSPRFLEALKELRERFDIILIDTPPVLPVSDPSIVAPRVDGLLLVLRVGRGTRPAAVRTREVLAALGVNLLGVVVNAVDAYRGGGKGDYGYGYRYDYEYGYGTGYAEADGDSQVHPARTGRPVPPIDPEEIPLGIPESKSR
jgi:capsular exopolysaccharide synthesis family protein